MRRLKTCSPALMAGVLTLAATGVASAQYTTPHVVSTPGPVTTVLGQSYFVNQGLVGVGRIPASAVDTFGDSLGSGSGLQVTGWTKTGSTSYAGLINLLPDRGYNSGAFFADYAARIQQIPFAFTPYTAAAPLGGASLAARLATQNQVLITGQVSGTRLTYFDPATSAQVATTGLDPAAGTITLFGKTMPYVANYTGLASPSSPAAATYAINRLSLDSEALVLKVDGSGYIGDEYGAHVYYFNASKEIVGAITPPDALRPRVGGVLNFRSGSAPNSGRRNNQGFEGVALSPDGTRLFVLLQSAAVQDTSSNNATRRHTRLLVYDVSGNVTPSAPLSEFVMTLPTYRQAGDGLAPDATAAQSELVALDNERILVLSRDGNGLGNASPNPSMFKSILLVNLAVGTPTDIAGSARDLATGKVTTSAGVLDPAVAPVQWAEVVNMLNSAQLSKFNIDLDSGAGQVSQLTLGEKWEGMSLVPALDPARPHDYFLFVVNDNDFLTSAGNMRGPGGPVTYDGFAGYPATRQPINGGTGNVNNNDTVFLVYRVTFVNDTDAPAFTGMPGDCSVWPPNHKMVHVATIAASDAGSGVAPGSLSVVVTGDDGTVEAQDIAVTLGANGERVVSVRAERTGGGDGRTYTITATATDNVGNVGTATTSCVVPHDRRN